MYFCECFHAFMFCMDLPPSGFLFSLTCLQPMYPQTPGVSLSTWRISQLNNIATKITVTVITSWGFWRRRRSQQSRMVTLRVQSLARWRGSAICEPVMMPLCVTSPFCTISTTIPQPQHLCRYSCTTSSGCLERTHGLLIWHQSFPRALKENLCWS